MSVYRQRNGKGWTIDYYRADGKRVREVVSGDKALAKRVERQRCEHEDKVRDGVADPFVERSKRRSLSEHIMDWAAHLALKGGDRHVADSVRKVNRILNESDIRRCNGIRKALIVVLTLGAAGSAAAQTGTGGAR